MTLVVTAIAAALLGLWHLRLSLGVIKLRRSLKVGMGDDGHDALARAIRAQANASEYIPIALILLACLELNGAPIWLTGILVVAFVIGRLLHGLSMLSIQAPGSFRVTGMLLTLFSILFLGITNLAWVALQMTGVL